MNKFYKQLSDEELGQEIKRLEASQNQKNDAYDREINGQTYLEKCRKELKYRRLLDQ